MNISSVYLMLLTKLVNGYVLNIKKLYEIQIQSAGKTGYATAKIASKRRVQFIHHSEESFVKLMMLLNNSRAVIFKKVLVIARDLKLVLMTLKLTRQK